MALLCITSAINYEVRSHINIDGQTLVSGDTMKIVGYTLGRCPGLEEHVKAIRKSYGARAWTIKHLKRTGIDTPTLVRIYCSMVRPLFDYVAPAYHTLLMADQSEELERMQRNVMKTIFGYDISYVDCLREAGIPALEQRREELFRVFAVKCWNSERWRSRWFKENEKSAYGLRNERVVVQEFAACDHLMKSPVHMIRRYINEIFRDGTAAARGVIFGI